ncbi:MAG TPA: MFS transporter, partial [Gammaproteobacteria bacterium]|nr:MFS transporter [Gammaproteobacteria bacterium]
PLLYIKDLGVSLAHYGFYQGILAFVFALGSILFGFMIKNGYDHKKMIYYSISIFSISLICIIITTIINSHSALLITLSFLIFIIGQIIPSNTLYPYSISFMPEAKAKTSAFIQAGKLILSALGLQLAGYFYRGSFQSLGMIIIVFIVAGLITLFLILNNKEINSNKLQT